MGSRGAKKAKAKKAMKTEEETGQARPDWDPRLAKAFWGTIPCICRKANAMARALGVLGAPYIVLVCLARQGWRGNVRGSVAG